jgi:glycosyltransferase involved in cell wall biosynthesis
MIVARPGYEPILAANSECGILETHGLVSGKFILGVSSRSPIKNFDTLIKAWKSLASSDTPLVIAGGYNSKVFGKRRLDNPDGVLFLGYVSDGELRALYENAACFVYPSLYEGFGLPPVEAMACGCPVIVSTCSALPETCGDAALYCEPFDVKGMGKAIEAVILDSKLRESLRSRGTERVRELSYQSCGALLWSSISELL